MTREFDDLRRESGSRNPDKIIIAFEGAVSERRYFKELRSRNQNPNLPQVIPLDYADSSPKAVFDSIHNYVQKKSNDVEKGDQVWLVVDVDEHSTLEEALKQCDEHGYFYAVSNPCFEFWLLLHICSIEEFDQTQLEAFLLNEKISNKHTALTQELSSRLLGGGGGTKGNVIPYIPFVPSAVMKAEQLDHEDFIPNAIQRSKDRTAPIEDVRMELGSTVYKLVKEILKGKL